MKNRNLRTEAFGPTSIIVRCGEPRGVLRNWSAMEGSLTGTIHAHEKDKALAKRFFPVVESRVGRLLWKASHQESSRAALPLITEGHGRPRLTQDTPPSDCSPTVALSVPYAGKASLVAPDSSGVTKSVHGTHFRCPAGRIDPKNHSRENRYAKTTGKDQ